MVSLVSNLNLQFGHREKTMFPCKGDSMHNANCFGGLKGDAFRKIVEDLGLCDPPGEPGWLSS